MSSELILETMTWSEWRHTVTKLIEHDNLDKARSMLDAAVGYYPMSDYSDLLDLVNGGSDE